MAWKHRQNTVASGPQPEQTHESLGGLAKFGLGLGAIGATGFIPTGNKRLWDHYLQGIRAVETGFPAAILRTFRVSESLSPLETWSKINLRQKAIQDRSVYSQYLQRALGDDVLEATVRRSKGIFGTISDQTGKPIGLAARIASGTQQGEGIADYYARLKGVNLKDGYSMREGALRTRHYAEDIKIPYEDWKKALPYAEKQPRIPLIARFRDEIDVFGKKVQVGHKMQRAIAKAEIFGNFARAKASTTVGRLNTLLTKPFEIPVVGDILHKIPFVKSMATKPGPHTAMTMGYIKKGLLAAGAIGTGAFYYDYLRSEGGLKSVVAGTAGGAALGAFLGKKAIQPFSVRGAAIGGALGLYTALSPRFDKGLFHGGLSIFTDANLFRAQASKAVGLQQSLRRQEEATPGLLSASSLIGFGAGGGVLAGTFGYGKMMIEAAKQRASTGKPLDEIFENIRLSWYGEGKNLGKMNQWMKKSAIGKKVFKLPVIGKHLSKIRSPMAAGAAAGAALWLGASTVLPILSGNFAAAVPGINLLGTEETPEELQAVYSGEEEVAVRKGRWWEFGRCIADSSMIPICCTGISKEAQDVSIGDILIGRNGEEAIVKAIFSRDFSGNVLCFKTRASWITETKVTGNHTVPVLREDRVEEVNAENLCIGDKVEVPRPSLMDTVSWLNTEDLIKTGLFLSDSFLVFPAQRNWYTNNLQISNGLSIPKSISLTPELGRLFGYFLAEGSLSYKNDLPHMVETVHSVSERWIVDDIISICEKNFNITPTVRFKKGKKQTDEGCWIVRICSSLLSRVFFELFYKSNRELDKIFPEIFMAAPEDFKRQLIEGYWYGDGHFDGATRVISSCRKDFIEHMFSLLLNLDEYPYICKFEENDFRGRYRIKWTPNKKPYFYHEFDGKLFSSICSIESEEYDGTVYDFEVDHPDHLFQAGTFLVHNSTAYGGGRVEYYRPHALHRLATRASEKGMWGSEEEKWAHEPLLHPLNALFGPDEWKYHYEQKYQQSRPAPLTSTYGEDVPFIGPLVAATVGRLLKPRKYVRPEEWMLGDDEFLYRPDRPDEEPVYELGGLKPGAPVSPDDTSQLLNELMYRRREAVGLIGFAEGAIQKSLTGREEVFQNQMTMATMGEETGSEYWLWKHLNLGGGSLTCFVPGTQIKTYDGNKNIEDIQIGDLVLSKGGYRKVVDRLEKQPQEALTTIKIREIDNEFTCTKNHWIPILRRHRYTSGHLKPFSEKNYSVVEVQARDIEENDFLFYPINQTEENHCIDLRDTGKSYTSTFVYFQASFEFAAAYELLEDNYCASRRELREVGVSDLIAKEAIRQFRQDSLPKRRPRYLSIDRDLAYAIGWYIAEGSTQEGSLIYTLNANEVVHAEEIARIFDKLGYNTRIKIEENTLRLWVYSSQLARFFKVFGCGAHNKKIPFQFKRLPIAILRRLAEGLILGDGWGEIGAVGGFTSVSAELVRDLYDVLLQLGQQSYLSINYIEKATGNYPQSTSRKDCKRSYLKFRQGRENWRIFENCMLVKVTDVLDTSEQTELVYDLTVEDIHYYTAEGILVHNTEPIRRFIPHDRSYLEKYNPLHNDMPSWMPNNYFIDLKHGNPFDKIPEAEIRLPGPGYIALHPELEGVDPEDYPLMHRLKILGDVAMWSPEYKAHLGMAKSSRSEMSNAQQKMMETIEEQVREKKQRRKFSDYRFRDEELADMQVTVRDVLGPREILTEELGPMTVELQGVGSTNDMSAAMGAAREALLGRKITVSTPMLESRRYDMLTAGPRMKAVAMIGDQDYGEWMSERGLTDYKPLEDEFEQLRYDVGDRIAGGLWENLTRAAETPAELLTPISPAAKFIRKRSAIEEYIQTEGVGTGSAFWDRPLSNFLIPAEEMAEYKLGDEDPSSVVEQRRSVQEYFDMLEWRKANEAARAAEADGNWSEAVAARQTRARTMFGMDPYANPTDVMTAMPRRSRDFFQAFSDAKTQQDRAQIMSLVSQQERRVYLAQWMKQHAAALKAKQAARIGTRQDAIILNKILMARRSDGYEYDDAIEAQWRNETGGQVPFDEWLREKKSEQYFRSRALPGPDWIGWHPSVDLEDVKAKYLRNEGMDHHDFDIWGDRMRSLARKPYLTDDAIAQLTPSDQLREDMNISSAAMVENAKNLRRSMKGGHPDITSMTIGAPGLSGYNINIEDKRSSLVDATMKQIGI